MNILKDTKKSIASGFIDIEKAHVKSYTKTSKKSGKMSMVKEHDDKRSKKAKPGKGESLKEIKHMVQIQKNHIVRCKEALKKVKTESVRNKLKESIEAARNIMEEYREKL